MRLILVLGLLKAVSFVLEARFPEAAQLTLEISLLKTTRRIVQSTSLTTPNPSLLLHSLNDSGSLTRLRVRHFLPVLREIF